MSDWETDDSKLIHETPWIQLIEEKVRNHNGKPMTFTYTKLKRPSVSIIAADKSGRILLQRNYRHNIRKFVWEIPAGHSDGQEPLTAAQRELLEEAGLASDDWTDMGLFYIAPGIAHVEQQYFLARNTYRASGEREADEQITEQRFFTLKEIDQMLLHNEIQSYMAPIGIYLAKLHGLKGEK